MKKFEVARPSGWHEKRKKTGTELKFPAEVEKKQLGRKRE